MDAITIVALILGVLLAILLICGLAAFLSHQAPPQNNDHQATRNNPYNALKGEVWFRGIGRISTQDPYIVQRPAPLQSPAHSLFRAGAQADFVARGKDRVTAKPCFVTGMACASPYCETCPRKQGKA